MTIDAEIRAYSSKFSLAMENYSRRRIQSELTPCLPGEFLDDDASVQSQHGLTAILIWIAFSRFHDDGNGPGEHSNAFFLLLREAVAVVRGESVEPSPETKSFMRDCNWQKLADDFCTSSFKRSLYVVTLSSTPNIVSEIEFLCSCASTVGENRGWGMYLDRAAAVDPIVTAYVLSSIEDSLYRFPEAVARLNTDVESTLSRAALYLLQSVEAPSDPITHLSMRRKVQDLFKLNVLYRLSRLGIRWNPIICEPQIRKSIESLLRDVDRTSKYDPLGIPNEIVVFKTLNKKTRYVRFNSDVILLESLLIAFKYRLEVLSWPIGRALKTRMFSPFREARFQEDSTGQRLAVYTAYNSRNQIDRIKGLNQKHSLILRPFKSMTSRFVVGLKYVYLFRRLSPVDMLLFLCLIIVGLVLSKLGADEAGRVFFALSAGSLISLLTRIFVEQRPEWRGIA